MKIFENLVFEGGGVKGLSYVGSLKALNNLNKINDIKKIIGTSVGSIFAVLAGCKCTNEEIELYATKFFAQIANFNDSYISEGIDFVKRLGLHSNESIYNVINSLLIEKFKKNNMTLHDLYNETKIEITIVGTCLSTRTKVYFNYKTYPDIEVAKAVQISTAIPLFFSLVEWNGMYWADGGIVENFAINYYDLSTGEYNEVTLGLCLKQESNSISNAAINSATSNTSLEKSVSVYKINGLIDLLKSIENTQLDNNVNQSIENGNRRNIIYINTGTISATQFNLADSDKQMLENNGYKSVVDYFSN